jgi:hypothetical protein
MLIVAFLEKDQYTNSQKIKQFLLLGSGTLEPVLLGWCTRR